MPTVHLIITGTVQGVFYRARTKDKATELGITGWVQNKPDGSVEVMATAPLQALDALIAWCRKGPRMAKVANVQVTKEEEQGFPDFLVKR